LVAAPVRAFTQRKASLFFSRRAAKPQSVPADSQGILGLASGSWDMNRGCRPGACLHATEGFLIFFTQSRKAAERAC